MVDDQTRSGIDRLNSKLSDQPFKLALVNVEDIELLTKNARHMNKKQFQNLVDNVKRDGGLSSAPFCHLQEDGKFLVLSGNHRVMAAKEAGLQEVMVMYTDKPLTEQQKIAIQLSHNAIVGEDDMAILKELWEEIDDLTEKYYAGLDDKTLEEMKKVTLGALSEVPLDYKTVSFMFLEDETARLGDTLEKIAKMLPGDVIYAAREKEFDRLIAANTKIQESYNVHTSAVSLMMLLDVFERHQEDLAEGWFEGEGTDNKKWVPLASIFGTDCIPAQAARILKQAVDKMSSKGDIEAKNKWQALEYMAAEYMGGA